MRAYIETRMSATEDTVKAAIAKFGPCATSLEVESGINKLFYFSNK